jgi:DNA-binding transcriptional LysR family regulator
VTAPILFGRLHVMPVANAFLLEYPEVNLRVTLSDQHVDLIDSHVDVAIRIGELPDSGLMATRVGSIRRVTCASPDYLVAHGTPKAPDELVKHACITFSALMSGANWLFKPPGRKPQSVIPRCRLFINTAEAAIDSAVSGLGVTQVLSYQAVEAVSKKQLKIILRDYEAPEIPVHLMHAHQSLLPSKMRQFLKFSAPRLRQSIARAQKTLGDTSDRAIQGERRGE